MSIATIPRWKLEDGAMVQAEDGDYIAVADAQDCCQETARTILMQLVVVKDYLKRWACLSEEDAAQYRDFDNPEKPSTPKEH
jgi:hypothetical protein